VTPLATFTAYPGRSRSATLYRVNENEPKSRRKSIPEIFAELPPEKRAEAGEAIGRYLRLVARIFKRIEADPEEYKKLLALTEEARTRRMGSGRDYKP
jgi:hypothetical protein